MEAHIDTPERPANAIDAYRLDGFPEAWRSLPPAGPLDGLAWRAWRSAMYGIAWTATGSRVRRIDEGGLGLATSGRPVILAANHRSHADAGIVYQGLPKRVRGRFRVVSAEAMLRVWGPHEQPLRRALGWVLVGTLEHGYRAVWVGGEARGSAAIERLVAALRDGNSLIMHPAGMKGTPDELTGFQFGVALASLGSGAPIIPVRLDGTKEALPQRGRIRTKAAITARFRAPIWPGGFTEPTSLLAALVEALRPPTG